jgi:hypothetical protein
MDGTVIRQGYRRSISGETMLHHSPFSGFFCSSFPGRMMRHPPGLGMILGPSARVFDGGQPAR